MNKILIVLGLLLCSVSQADTPPPTSITKLKAGSSTGVAVANSGNISILAGSASGDVLTWTGTDWVSDALPASGVTSVGATSPIASSGGSTPTISIAVASHTSAGALSSSDWDTFSAKQSALTFGDLTAAGTDGISVTGGTGAVIGSGSSLAQHVSDSTHNGYLASTDWAIFNAKQAALADIVSASTSTKVTYNAKGLITGGTSLTFADTPVVPVGRTFWVDSSRSDSYTPDGSILRPFKTIQAAVNQIITNADNTSTTPYNILINAAPGTEDVDMSNSALVYVNMRGNSGTEHDAVGMNTLTLTSSAFFKGTFDHLSILGLTTNTPVADQVNFQNTQLNTASISGAAQNNMYNCQVSSTFTITSSGFVFWSSGQSVGNTTIQTDSNMVFQGSSFLGTINVDSTSGLFLRNGARIASGAVTLNGTMQAYSAWLGTTITIGATGNLLNRGSFLNPASVVNVLGGTYTQGTIGAMLGYTPATSGNWSTVPSNVGSALDGIAAGNANAYLRTDGSRALSADWNAGAHVITATTFVGALTGAASSNVLKAGDTMTGALLYSGTTPSISSCGVSPSVVGNDNVGRITVGTGGVASSCTITFAAAWTNKPICLISDESTALLVTPAPTTTSLVISAATPFGASDSIGYRCVGYL